MSGSTHIYRTLSLYMRPEKKKFTGNFQVLQRNFSPWVTVSKMPTNYFVGRACCFQKEVML
jgi:hypothetical protein